MRTIVCAFLILSAPAWVSAQERVPQLDDRDVPPGLERPVPPPPISPPLGWFNSDQRE